MSESRSEVVLTASDGEYFEGLQELVKSIQSQWNYPIVAVDLGLWPGHLEWLDSRGVTVHSVSSLSAIPELPGEAEYIRKLWIKPFFFQTVCDRVVWIDSDAIVLRDLDRLFHMLDDGPVFTTTGNDHEPARNRPELYELLPVAPHPVTRRYLNAGVLGLDTVRDHELLETWTSCVTEAMSRKEVAAAIRNQDQGALLWSLHRLDLLDRITLARNWNCLPNLPHGAPIPRLEDLGKGRRRYPRGPGLLRQLRRDHPLANIVHWCARPKLWELWQ